MPDHSNMYPRTNLSVGDCPCLANDHHHRYHHRGLDFLVISPPKTGSTWLAENLRRHPQIFVPKVKEIKYFSSFYKWMDYRWYSAQFDEAGSRLRGEASPSYASLPLDSIQTLRRLSPELKLVYLMRDPISRAWSHVKHNHKYQEGSFALSPDSLDPATVDNAHWRESFRHEWVLASGDYLGQLRRWTSVFPKEQIYIGFYESIESRTEDVLREVFKFLGVSSEVDLSDFPTREHFLTGPSLPINPELASTLHHLLHHRTLELVEFLKQGFNLEPPCEWDRTLETLPVDRPSSFETIEWKVVEDSAARVLEMEEIFPFAFRHVEHYRGFHVAIYRGEMCALPESLGPHAMMEMDQMLLDELKKKGDCITARTRAEIKEKITNHVLKQTLGRRVAAAGDRAEAPPALSRSAQEAYEANVRVTSELHALIARLQEPSRLRKLLRKWLGPTRRRLRALRGRLLARMRQRAGLP